MTDIKENGFEPALFLVKNIELFPKGRALTVAMGTGGFWFVWYAFHPEAELYPKEKLDF